MRYYETNQFKFMSYNIPFQHKNLKNVFFLSFIMLSNLAVYSQTGTLKGKVTDATTNEPIPFATIFLQGVTLGGTSDSIGNYVISAIPPNIYNIIASSIGYESQTVSEINITSTKTTILDLQLSQNAIGLSEVQVTVGRFEKSTETPLSKITVRSSEILRNPGGNRDISKVLQSFPGVASSVSFRNDLIVRGGAPNENRFYLDGIEVPNINHFSTQGSSGGPVGMINVNFINEVQFYSGSFPSNRGNVLSSILEFKQKNGNPDRLVTNVMLGSSDIGITLDGPISKKSDFIFSIRRSYLQLLFSALKLPFLPTYNDAQFKVNYTINEKNSISVIGLGAIDQFALNKKVNDGISDSLLIDRNNYILGYLPSNEQWNYVIGIIYKHIRSNGYQNIILSRNMLNNTSTKFLDNNNAVPSNLILDYNSAESENKARFESTIINNNSRFSFGFCYEYAFYSNQTFNRIFVPSGTAIINYDSKLRMNKFGAFSQYSLGLLNNKLQLSAGMRIDANDYSSEMSNPFKQFSPRLSISYQLTNKIYANFNTGIYFQLPAYTVLGYRDSSGQLTNKKNKVSYIESDHLIFGLEFQPNQNTKITAESFYKFYSKYPLLINEQISLANMGSDFGVVGNAPVSSVSNGKSYGIEFLIQRTIKKGFYGIVAYTFLKSEFTNASTIYAPSSWDSRNLVSITGGKQFKKNWELGIKFRYFGGNPYTPYNYNTSALISVWDITHTGVLDYTKINTERFPATHQLDIRLDKKIYFKKKVLDIYIDIQNIYNKKTVNLPYLTTYMDMNNQPVKDPLDSNRYLLKEIKNESGTVLPSIGLMFEF
ncbi:TonB-dependent receptor [soil metagenome]